MAVRGYKAELPEEEKKQTVWDAGKVGELGYKDVLPFHPKQNFSKGKHHGAD